MGSELASSGRQTRDAVLFHLSVLGALRLTDTGTGADSTPKSRKARALIAYLALTETGPVRREQLATFLWGDRPEEQSRTNLRQTLFELRDLAGGEALLLVVDRDAIGLNRSRLRSDADAIRALARVRDMSGLQSALAPWDGAVLSDLDSISPEFDEWLAVVRARESEAIVREGAEAVTAAMDAGDSRASAVIAFLTAIEPTNERVLRLALRSDAKAGDSAALHRRYRAFKENLRNELNAAPSAETQLLFRSLVSPDVDGGGPPHRALLGDAAGRTSRASASIATPEVVPAVRQERRSSRARWAVAGIAAAALGAAAIVFVLPPGDRKPAPNVPVRQGAATPAVDRAAYELYRRGVEASRQRTALGRVQAEALLESAVARAPNFSRGWSALAFAQSVLAGNAIKDGKPPQEVDRWTRAATESANRAIALDPNNGEPYGVLVFFVDTPETERLRLLDKGLALEPDNVFLLRLHGQEMFALGLADAALADFERAQRLDPLDARTMANLSDALIAAGRVSEARVVLNKGVAIYPQYLHLWRQKLSAVLSDGEFDAADAMLSPKAVRPTPEWERAAPEMRLIARALRTGHRSDVDAALGPLREEARTAAPGEVEWVVWKMALLGRIDDAYGVIERAEPDHACCTYEIFVDVIFAPLRRDPRFMALWASRYIPYWQTTGQWPAFCRDPELTYDCKIEAAKVMARHGD